MNTFSKPNEQLFPNRWPLSYLNLTKMGHNVRKCTFVQIFEYKKTKHSLNVIMFLEFDSLYLTRLFQLFCEL